MSQILNQIVILSFIFIILIFIHTLLSDDNDPDLQLSNKLFFRIVIIVAISTYITHWFCSSSTAKSALGTAQSFSFTGGDKIDRHW
tara:strand:+ start:1045 stop:1302 length:258 start_codon:yes stop_codon:yes gene_type:complete